MKRWVSVCVLVLGACASSGAGIEESREFVDALGRACQAKLSRTSEHASAVSESVTCDRMPRECSGESRACFELSTGKKEDGYALRNCPACCLGTASSFAMAECSPVVCTTDADCIFGRAKCEGGACVCPNGICD
jgi:hypothetical protein